ncbi:MAG: U32 family peptidase [Spirochaetaceae bacterium]|jgi:putative protease|nr:U32 family peptidase [Spirochaetaceae bacterium]
MTELLAPGGSFSASITALKMGADAVYCGLPDFSARRSAKNLDLEQLYRLREYAENHNKKIYLALNTIISQDQWPKLLETLSHLEPLAPQGIILQDLGLLHLLKKEFPHFPLHGSTQLAVHNPSATQQALRLGMERVVLSRECSLDQIKKIHHSCPKMELEVFIHGALCVSFSGLCFASGQLLGRSANRGECGQICRTWFQHPSGPGYYFSARDLELGRNILALRDIGVISFKIEGRMKSPEYAGWTSAYYRAILDGASQDEILKLREKSLQAFSRPSTSGWLEEARGKTMIQRDYPGHRGLELGELKSGGEIKLKQPLSRRDGLLYLAEGHIPSGANIEEANKTFKIPKAISFAAEFSKGQSSQGSEAEEGQTITLKKHLPGNGYLYRTSRHNQRLPHEKEEVYAPYRIKGQLEISWHQDQLEIMTQLPFMKHRWNCEQTWEKAKNPGVLKEQMVKLFQTSQGGPVNVSTLKWADGDFDSAFLPMSRLKEIRRLWRAEVDQAIKTHIKNRLQGLMSQGDFPESSRFKGELTDHQLLNQRATLNPVPGDLPFLLHPEDCTLEDFFVSSGTYYIPLNPILMDEEAYFTSLIEFLDQHTSEIFVLGLNNLGHLKLVDTQKDNKNIHFWVDYGLYCANESARDFFIQRIPRLKGILHWIEGSPDSADTLGLSHGKNFIPPLFSSAVCFHRHSLGQGCPKNCTKHFDYEIEQNGIKYKLLVRDCMSYLVNVPKL